MIHKTRRPRYTSYGLLRKIDEQAEEAQGVDFSALFDAWQKAGKPNTPEALIDFLEKNAKIDKAGVAKAFDFIGIKLDPAWGAGREMLDDENVKKIQTYLGSLNAEELKTLYGQVKGIKVAGPEERASAAALGA